MAVSFALKVYTAQGDIDCEIINVPSLDDFSFGELCRAVHGLIAEADLAKLTWEDAEGERIRLQSDNNLKAAMKRLHRLRDGSQALKIHVFSSPAIQVNSSQPNALFVQREEQVTQTEETRVVFAKVEPVENDGPIAYIDPKTGDMVSDVPAETSPGAPADASANAVGISEIGESEVAVIQSRVTSAQLVKEEVKEEQLGGDVPEEVPMDSGNLNDGLCTDYLSETGEVFAGILPPHGNDGSSNSNIVNVSCRSVRVGTFRAEQRNNSFNVEFSSFGVCVPLKGASTNSEDQAASSSDVNLTLPFTGIGNIQFLFSRKLKVLFLTLSARVASDVRNSLHLSVQEFDESTIEAHRKYLVIILEDMSAEQHQFLTRLLAEFERKCCLHGNRAPLTTLLPTQAEALLRETVPPEFPAQMLPNPPPPVASTASVGLPQTRPIVPAGPSMASSGRRGLPTAASGRRGAIGVCMTTAEHAKRLRLEDS